jgi:hypothetical protein
VRARFDGARLAADVTAEEPAGTLLGAPLSARLHLDGPASGAEWRLDARYGEAAAALTGTAAREAAATRLAGGGTVEAAAFLPEALRPLLTGARIAFAGRYGDDGRLALEPTTLEAPAGTLRVAGEALPVLGLDVALDLAGSERFSALLPPGLGWQALSARGRVSGAPSNPLIEARVAPEGLATGIALADSALGPAPALALRLTPDLAGSRVTLEGPAVAATVEGDFGETLDLRGEVRLAAAPQPLPPARMAHRPPNETRARDLQVAGPAHLRLRRERPSGREPRPHRPPNVRRAPPPRAAGPARRRPPRRRARRSSGRRPTGRDHRTGLERGAPRPARRAARPHRGQRHPRLHRARPARRPRADPGPRRAAPARAGGTTTITADALAIRAEVLNPLTAPRGTALGTGRVMGLPLELDIAAQPETADGVPGARITRGALAFGPARLALSGLVQPRGKPDEPRRRPARAGRAEAGGAGPRPLLRARRAARSPAR